jgi:transporter family-2 protein
MQLTPYLTALIAGALLTVQVGLNATLGRAVGHMRFAVLMNFLVGSAGLLVYLTMWRCRRWSVRASAPRRFWR